MMKVNRMDEIHPVRLNVDVQATAQTIDGFGMNINPVYWEEGRLIPVMELFHHDLEANLYRLDVYGRSNWVDPENLYGKEVLTEDTYRKVYRSKSFQDAWTMARHLNANGIKPYLNASGIVPDWMCGEDGKTLTDFESFSEMMASMLHWARVEENIDFKLFGPLNETDLGPPEGPLLNPESYARCCEVLADTLERWGLGDVKLVVAEQAMHNPEYTKHLLSSKKLSGKIGVLCMHAYTETRFADVPVQLAEYSDRSTRFWITEYGDLDETGAIEWEVALNSTRRILWALLDGAQAGIVWDAFDNYHDHDNAWSLYGLLRRGRLDYTPKKRYYAARQIYKYVKPGSVRVEVTSDDDQVLAAAFWHELHGLTVAGINWHAGPVRLSFNTGTANGTPFRGVVTNEEMNASELGRFVNVDGVLTILIPGNTIFTLSQSQVKEM